MHQEDDVMAEDDVQNIDLKRYLMLKQEVNDLYNVMMQMHMLQQRDAAYANARAAYMEKRNILQRALEAHPEFEQA